MLSKRIDSLSNLSCLAKLIFQTTKRCTEAKNGRTETYLQAKQQERKMTGLMNEQGMTQFKPSKDPL